MSAPVPRRSGMHPPSGAHDNGGQRPAPSVLQTTAEEPAETVSTPRPVATPTQEAPRKKRNHRGGKKKRRPRRQSFSRSEEDANDPRTPHSNRPAKVKSGARSSFYMMQGQNLSNTSIDSEALLDHREQPSIRPRRASTMQSANAFGQSVYESPIAYRPAYLNPFGSAETAHRQTTIENGSGDEGFGNERAPLLSSSRPKTSGPELGYGGLGGESSKPKLSRQSSKSSGRSKKKPTIFDKQGPAFPTQNEEYNVNYPPSVPGSPSMGAADMTYGDMLSRDDFSSARALSLGPETSSSNAIDNNVSPPKEIIQRRHTIALQAQEDVCFPIEGMSDIGDYDMTQQDDSGYRNNNASRRRRPKWPDLSILDEWSRFEKEGRSEERRAKRITEPQLIGGRLRPTHKGWHRAEDDAPYRFTYFNEEFQSTIHSQTISELVQPGSSFRELFIPDRPVLSDSESDGEDSEEENDPMFRQRDDSRFRHVPGSNGESRASSRQLSLAEQARFVAGYVGDATSRAESVKGNEQQGSQETSSTTTTKAEKSPRTTSPLPPKSEKPKRYGERPTWWIDILSPTEAEMKVISKAFGIHPLTAEDIMMQEAREKVELFRNYYFVNYRSFEQDMNNEDFLEPVNMYVVVFREGVLSFHFSMTPHPANVRRRIRQLKDYLILSSDWISYAIIDDITDVFAPLIQNIEDEVDDIDDEILKMHSPDALEEQKSNKDNEKNLDAGDVTTGQSGGDMLRRVGNCRKKVMGLYRLLGNKADVIKGFAKRCNEHWEIAPRSEIGLYLGDIQDHIVTMTGNLSHYEKILARSHGNYLAQINIRMNERQEQTADVLGKLTVLGTIVLPMNIITGLWGMNVWVPGQEYEGDLTWFWCLTAGLLVFGLSCFFIAKLLYRIV
ncbi:hypothetical protein BJ878DRAFT_147525 [Calycina marina]|uniref:Uncharacterized protein n=1 Tax=Calycina marina TaxID=1763456 RepID=A0A9P7YZK3_9HELO|nr:hypothetical protein BJ878DRAFT_147525 [Calycina marina]